jgi:hypothetical protein
MARKKNVAQVIVDVLASAGVRRVYGVAGDSLNGLTDAIFSHDDMAWIHVGTRRRAPLPPAPRRTSPESCASVPGVRGRVTCT